MSSLRQWSREAETNLMLRRMGGDKSAQEPAFWPGRPSLHYSECPIVADGELLTITHEAVRAIAEAQTALHDALTSNHEYTDRDLQTAQESLRKAIAKIETLRQRIVGAGAILESIEREAESKPSPVHAPKLEWDTMEDAGQ